MQYLFESDEHVDIVPHIVKLYSKLRHGKPFEFKVGMNDVVRMRVKDITKESVTLCVNFARAGYEERLPVSHVLRMLRNFFDELLDSSGFPYLFPDGDQTSKIFSEDECEVLEEHAGTIFPDVRYHIAENKEIFMSFLDIDYSSDTQKDMEAYAIAVRDAMIADRRWNDEYSAKYRKMLKARKVPSRWFKLTQPKWEKA